MAIKLQNSYAMGKMYSLLLHRGRDFITCHIPDKTSWMLRKKMPCRDIIMDWNGWERVMRDTKFSIAKAYAYLSPQQP